MPDRTGSLPSGQAMPTAGSSALAEGGYPAPADVGDLAACVCHSLAECYRAAVDELEALRLALDEVGPRKELGR